LGYKGDSRVTIYPFVRYYDHKFIEEEVKKMKKLGKKAKVHENSLSAYCSSACTCLTITCTCSSTSHDPTGNYFQGDVKADSAGTIVWL